MFSSNTIIKDTRVFQYFEIGCQSVLLFSVKIIKIRETSSSLTD